MARWKNGAQAASLIRNVIEDFHKSGINFDWKRPERKPIQKQKANAEKNINEVLHNISKEEHLSCTYRHYLTSTMRLEALQEQYKGGERSLEESARLVGLKIPVSKSE
uniref:Protein FMC1 homolog n=1 Tax=Onchocerca volvulus TaxID=6282 RepID=A0A8R1TSQ3_ONCVO